jgi:mgtE-like transporter
MTRRHPIGERLSALFGPVPTAARQSFAALAVGLAASLVAGLTLGAISGTLEALPGLLVLVPAAIGLRGTIFGALGARLSTAIHTGTFGLTLRADTVAGQNLLAAGVLTLVASVAMAVLAKVVSVGFGLADTISMADFVMISFIAGILSSVVVMAITVGLAASAVRFGWDADNVMAPLVTAAGDMVTLPFLFLATHLIDNQALTNSVAVAAAVVSMLALVAAMRSGLPVLTRVLRESVPVVLLAGMLSLVAGLTLEGRLDQLVEYPALLALVPPFLASAGAIGGILSSRLTSKLHLGLVEPSSVPGRLVRADMALAFMVAVPTFALASLVADLAAVIIDLNSPGAGAMIAVALIGGLMATAFAVMIAYYTAIVSYRMGLDPDNYAIPMVTSSIDLLGSISFILAVALVVSEGVGG